MADRSSYSPLLKSKAFLYLTEFFAGMAAMAVELGASRLLAPYFSSSQVIWTIIIATIMIAMSIGNVLGGRWADKDPDPGRLYRRLTIAGIWIAVIPFAGRYLIPGISILVAALTITGFLAWASFLTCLVLFAFPLVLLGTVTPSLTKYAVDNLNDNGRTVGTFIALNTIGSIIGTFLPTFVTIPAAGTAATFVIFSLVPIALGVIYFISVRKRPVLCCLAVAIAVACGVASGSYTYVFWDDTVVHEDESIYNYLQVKQTPTETSLSTNVAFGVQSVKPVAGRLTGMYYDYAMAAPYMAGLTPDSDAKVLVLGLGSGTYATQVLEYFPNATVDGVEIDQKIVDLADEYFDMDPRVNAIVGDGRASLSSLGTYDVIMVDAYSDITPPFQMATVEFFSQVKAHLNPNGVMVVNMNMRDPGPGGLNNYLSDTIGQVFSTIDTVILSGATNQELFASDNPQMLERMRTGLALGQQPTLERYLQRTVASNLVAYTPGNLVLTDDKAPVEILGIRSLDAIIQSELDYYHRVFREQGISGVMSAL